MAEIKVNDGVVYGAVTLKCIDRLRADVHNCVNMMRSDDGPHWLCTVLVSETLENRITSIRRHIKVKKEYATTDEELLVVCNKLEDVIRGVEEVLRGEIFNRFNFLGEIIRYKYLRRYAAPGCCEVSAGIAACGRLQEYCDKLKLLKEMIVPGVSKMLQPTAIEITASLTP